MRTHFASTALFGTLLGALGTLAGCGQLEGDPNRLPVLATIQGQLSNPEGYAAGSNMRVAIVWGAETDDLRVSQDVPVKPVFPSQFRLDLRELPPMDALRVPDDGSSHHQKPNGPSDCAQGYDSSSGKPPPTSSTLCDDGPPMAGPGPTPALPSPTTRIQSDDWRAATASDPFKLALGTVIAYEDLNGNGQLDLIDEGATQAVDRVIGVNRDLFVVYIEGTPSSSGDVAQLGLKPGFSLLKLEACPVLAGMATSGTVVPEDGNSCDATPKVLAISTLFTLPLTASPKLSSFMCKGQGSFTGLTSAGGAAAPAPAATSKSPSVYPMPTDPSLHCRGDGTSYSYTDCPTPKLCGGDTLCTTTLVQRTATASGQWPCPAQ